MFMCVRCRSGVVAVTRSAGTRCPVTSDKGTRVAGGPLDVADRSADGGWLLGGLGERPSGFGSAPSTTTVFCHHVFVFVYFCYERLYYFV